ncbi:unnamed protein product [Bursaphelenchus okinawaensis]|uniref:Adenylate kinase isoenzyme 6 homolog n=1 Tax=Bursaphelenchus okinawaensis TaxID=465554 RepID=A0A811KW64_9BILA|nr:unnamed protein product [Bursaphelenchus okinawaensis]CAG9113176.1 unnamed protein product [Bursaphelenchus okinawaensis]
MWSINVTMKTSKDVRKRPNILVTGVPGTGKSTFAPKIAEKCGLTFMDINKMILEFKLHSGYDNDYKSFILDEDKLLDHLEEYFDETHLEGGLVIDYHACDFFPERWFDIVVVLRCDNTQLYDRLKTRNYSEKKLRENIECEIFGTIAEEAEDAYKEGVVHQLQNSTLEELEKNLETIGQLVVNYKA